MPSSIQPPKASKVRNKEVVWAHEAQHPLHLAYVALVRMRRQIAAMLEELTEWEDYLEEVLEENDMPLPQFHRKMEKGKEWE